MATKPKAVSLSQFDWDFSTCPTDELRSCYNYERTRESKVHRDSLLEWRRNHKGSTFDDWLPIASEPSRAGRPPLFGWELFTYCPEWPEQPYLAIPQAERQRRQNLIPKIIEQADITNALRLVHLPKLLKDFSDGTPTGKKWLLPPLNRATVNPGYDIQKPMASDPFPHEPVPLDHETVAFEIDWRHSDGNLSKLFQLWLKSNRPKEVRQWIIKGKGRTSEQLRKDLKALGAWRLLKKMKWDAAAEHTANLSPTGKALFDNQAAWISARKHAQSLLKSFIG
jgi:hypothetical protein